MRIREIPECRSRGRTAPPPKMNKMKSGFSSDNKKKKIKTNQKEKTMEKVCSHPLNVKKVPKLYN